MPEADSKLISVLEAIFCDEYTDEATGELSPAEHRRVRGLIRDYLEITDSPNSREPYQIADFIYWNCWSASRAAAERYLASLTDTQVAELNLGDVLALLQPGLERDVGELADENEDERQDEKEG